MAYSGYRDFECLGNEVFVSSEVTIDNSLITKNNLRVSITVQLLVLIRVTLVKAGKPKKRQSLGQSTLNNSLWHNIP